jgi:hypothetical protein
MPNESKEIDFSQVGSIEVSAGTEIEIEKDPERIQEAFDEQGKILDLVKEAGRTICQLAKRLIPFRDERMWFYLGYTSFQEWYQNIGLSKTTIYRAINIFETFVLEYKISEDDVYACDIKKLDMLLPLKNATIDGATVLNEESVSEWLEKAKTLSQGDLITEVSSARGKKSTVQNLIENENLYRGTYVLVKTTEDVSQLRVMSDKKVPVELYKNDEGDFIVRIV